MINYFENELDKSVFTTSYVMEKDSPIVYVVHDEEGDWQFFGSEEITEEDSMIVSLSQIIKKDPSLMELKDLELGMEAFRKNEKSKFQRNKIEE